MVERKLENIEEIVRDIKEKFNIIGRDEELKRVFLAVKNGKHVLLEGPVGVGKTTLALAVAQYLNRKVYRVDGDERYTEQKLVGWFDPPAVVAKGYTWESFIPGPLTKSMIEGAVLFINELNRLPEGTQNVLLPAMDERKIVIPKIGVVEAKPGFLIIATQNPEEFVGTSRLSEALRDRFVWIGLKYQSEKEEELIVIKETGCENKFLVKLGVRIVRKSRENSEIKRGSSVRGAIDFVDLLKSRNVNSISKEEYVNAAIMALYNKIELDMRSKRSKEEVISEITTASLKELSLKVNMSKMQVNSFGSEESEPKNERKGIVEPNSFKSIVVRRESDVASRMMSTLLTDMQSEHEEVLSAFKSAVEKKLFWPALETYITIYDRISENEKEKVERVVSRIIALIASMMGERGYRKYMRKRGSYVFGSEEFDIEETLENYFGNKILEYGDIVAVHKIPKKVAVALMLDVSNSMQRRNIVTAAIAVATLACKLERDYYSIIAFKDEAEVIKSVKEKLPPEELIRRILNLKTGGLTNIEKALKMGVSELREANIFSDIGECMGILVTDGWVTSGGDPRNVAGEYSKLHVIQVGVGGGRDESIELAMDLARIGRGKYLFVKRFDDLPNAIINLFRSM